VKILIAEDDRPMRDLLQRLILTTGHQMLLASNGEEVLAIARQEQPDIVVTDWMMPKISGVELCGYLRSAGPGQPYVYIILLTARDRREDILYGLEAGADDYIVKPFDRDELVGRIRVGERLVRLEALLRGRNEELEQSLQTIRRLKSLLPICMFCKKICADQDYGQQIDAYIHEQTGADFTHGVCPECFEKHYPEAYRTLQDEKRGQSGGDSVAPSAPV